jgi:16S rRNA (uracil1498-N3)-methyltransferase
VFPAENQEDSPFSEEKKPKHRRSRVPLPIESDAVPRLFVAGDLAENLPLPLDPGQTHYLGAVMRLAAGDEIALFNGRDGEWRARLTLLTRNRAEALPFQQTRPQTPAADIWLAFAPLKRDATDLVVQKATELGVSVLQPVFTARTNTARLNTGRLTAIAREAAEQSERLTIPDLRPAQTLPDLLATWPPGRILAAAIERLPQAPPIAAAGGLLIGPEGGFAPAELDLLRSASFVSPLCLGPLVLRAETASIAGLAILQAKTWSTT